MKKSFDQLKTSSKTLNRDELLKLKGGSDAGFMSYVISRGIEFGAAVYDLFNDEEDYYSDIPEC